MPNLSQEELRRLARLGAKARLDELRREEAAIRAEFPDLFRGGGGTRRRRGGGRAAATAGAPGGATKRGSRRRRMSAANRKAVSARMKKYWAERRKAKAGK
jgi:hypothetical protein